MFCTQRPAYSNDSKNLDWSDQGRNDTKSEQSRRPSIQISSSSTKVVDKSIQIDKLIANADEPDELFGLIDAHLDDLTADQVERIYKRLFNLFTRSMIKLKEHNHAPLQRFSKAVRQSTVFKRLLHRTVKLNDQLSDECLLIVFRFFNSINLRPHSNSLVVILNRLLDRSNDFKLDQLSGFLNTLNNYTANVLNTRRSSKSNSDESEDDLSANFFSNLTELCFKTAKNRLLNNELEPNDVKLTIAYYRLFLTTEDEEMINFLTERLLADAIQFDFALSIQLLNSIRGATNTKLRKSNWTNDLNPDVRLIEKCNLAIINTLTSFSSPSASGSGKIQFGNLPKDEETNELDKMIAIYLNKLHDRQDDSAFNLEAINDRKILDLIAPILVEKQKLIRPHMKYSIFNMLVNYSRFRIYDESQLKLFYDLLCKDKKMRSNLGLKMFSILHIFRLPFVDYGHLSKLILDEIAFEDPNRLPIVILLRAVSEFILNDVNHRRLIDCFDILLSRQHTGAFSVGVKKHLNIARAYLAESSIIDKQRLEEKFDELFAKNYSLSIDEIFKVLDDDCLNIDTRLRVNAFLSNGLCLERLAIYDKSIDDLISLVDLKDHQVNKIPLNENQEL